LSQLSELELGAFAGRAHLDLFVRRPPLALLPPLALPPLLVFSVQNLGSGEQTPAQLHVLLGGLCFGLFLGLLELGLPAAAELLVPLGRRRDCPLGRLLVGGLGPAAELLLLFEGLGLGLALGLLEVGLPAATETLGGAVLLVRLGHGERIAGRRVRVRPPFWVLGLGLRVAPAPVAARGAVRPQRVD